MNKIFSRADISSALVCLKGESQNKGALFSLHVFMIRHGLDAAFRRAIYNLEIFNVTNNKWIYSGMITPILIDQVYNHMKNDDIEFKKITGKKARARNLNRIKNLIDKYEIKNNDIYISVHSGKRFPEELLQKGISMGNGIFFINLKHIEDYERSNAGG